MYIETQVAASPSTTTLLFTKKQLAVVETNKYGTPHIYSKQILDTSYQNTQQNDVQRSVLYLIIMMLWIHK